MEGFGRRAVRSRGIYIFGPENVADNNNIARLLWCPRWIVLGLDFGRTFRGLQAKTRTIL